MKNKTNYSNTLISWWLMRNTTTEFISTLDMSHSSTCACGCDQSCFKWHCVTWPIAEINKSHNLKCQLLHIFKKLQDLGFNRQSSLAMCEFVPGERKYHQKQIETMLKNLWSAHKEQHSYGSDQEARELWKSFRDGLFISCKFAKHNIQLLLQKKLTTWSV